MKAGRFLLSALCLGAAAVSLASCAADLARGDVDPVVADRVLASAADQVRRCYRTPRVASAGKQIVTRLAVRLNADGSLAGLPVIVGQTGVTDANKDYAEAMAEAAALAVIRCAPLHLPPEHYARIWSLFELKFSPRRAA